MVKRSTQSLETTNTNSVSQAIRSAFDVLGPVSKQRLFVCLRDVYEIDIWSATLSDLQEIKKAIVDIFDENAANLLIQMVYDEIERT